MRQLKIGYFVLTWLNIYAVSYYFNYIFFHLREVFGFGNFENLLFAALNGLIYVPASWYGGKFAQRYGYLTALKIGVGAMTLVLAAGPWLPGLSGQIGVMVLWTMAVCLTWAPLEALASANESRAGLSHMVGIYNIVWSGGAAVAFFTGGALQALLGRASLFWLPATLHGMQWVLLLFLERRGRLVLASHKATSAPLDATGTTSPEHHVEPAAAKAFLWMAWLANPFAYVAMNTIVPLLPDVAARLNLSIALAGFVGSVWMFARFFAFVLLWRWTAWHYNFGWLIGSYLTMVVSFGSLLLASNLVVVVVAQLAFGLAVGLIYFSSLFYSMDVGGESQGEHGGFHEALIGLGIFCGPAVGAITLRFLPGSSNVGVWAVSALLVLGFAGLLRLRSRR
jgi:predicted MFS family arabinose efflux permease